LNINKPMLTQPGEQIVSGQPSSGRSARVWAAALLGTNKNMCGGASLVVVGGVMVAGAVVCGGQMRIVDCV
jgi:hypothetical protein